MKEKIYDEILTLDNEDYIIIDEIVFNDNKYIYVQLVSNKKEYTILQETIENEKKFVESVDEKMH